jgi:hypothetical protein
MVRPEQIRVMPLTPPVPLISLPSQTWPASLEPGANRGVDGSRAVVEKLTFYGHDASVELRLTPGGRSVRVRVAGYLSPQVGETVALMVEGDVVAYATR